MSEISEIMWETMQCHYRAIVENICAEYETNPKYQIKKFYDGLMLTGFCVYYDTAEYRMLEAGYYSGKNKLVALKMWKFCTNGAKVLRAQIQKSNTPMYEFYKKMDFKIIEENLSNYTFEG